MDYANRLVKISVYAANQIPNVYDIKNFSFSLNFAPSFNKSTVVYVGGWYYNAYIGGCGTISSVLIAPNYYGSMEEYFRYGNTGIYSQ